MQALLIDPVAKTVEKIAVAPFDDVRALYGLLDVSNVELVYLPNGDALFVDGEGLLKDDPGPFFQYADNQPIPGKGLIARMAESGQSIRPRHNLNELRRLVSFPDIKLAGLENYTGTANPFGLGPMPVIGVRAVFRPK